MSANPKSLTIRAYQVGFGDCFLLSFDYGANKEKHVLVDFGSTKLPPGVPKTRMLDIALNIKERTKNKLHAVVATHRHKDHISGFATKADGKGPGDIIRAMKPGVVVQPWTEDPNIPVNAKGPKTQGFRLRQALGFMHEVAGYTLAETKQLRRHLPQELKAQLDFLGEDNLSNASAVKNLMTMGKNVYVYCGSGAGLGTALPGVKVSVLGPPTLKQTETIKKQKRTDQAEYWHFQARGMQLAQNAIGGNGELFPKFIASRGPSFPIDARWSIFHARRMRGDQLLQIVRVLDKAMNNTSLILVLEAGNKKLLFPGDAQGENWAYALGQKKYQNLLKSVNVYKVGHHGSLNATPKSLWALFDNRAPNPSAGRLKSLLSTMEKLHGDEDTQTEVPRRTLVSTLKKHSDLHSTQDVKREDLYFETTMTL